MENDRKLFHQGKSIAFDFQCHENWQSMSKTEKGRLCQSCEKSIYDFRDWDTQDVHQLIQSEKKKNQKVCGIFRHDQIQKYYTKYERRRGELHPQLKFLAALVLVFGLGLFSCRQELPAPTQEEVRMVKTETPAIPQDNYGKQFTADLNLVRRVIPPPPPIDWEIGGYVEPLGGVPAYDPIDEPPLMGDIQETMPPYGNGVLVDPDYPGGERDLYRYIQDHLEYPRAAVDLGLEGRVYVQFVVNSDGGIQEAEIVKGVDPILNDAALTLVNEMPKWNPGMQGDQPVNVSFTLPISFVLR